MLRRGRPLPRVLTARSVPAGERLALASVLSAAGLPTEDIDEAGREFFAFRDRRGALMGYGGLEVQGTDALLRSVLVVPEMRDRGLGIAIVERMEALALRRGVRVLYLLTTTARPFFEHRGFAAIDRAEVPSTIAATREFSSYCPANAVLMRRQLV